MTGHEPFFVHNRAYVRTLEGETLSVSYLVRLNCFSCDFRDTRQTDNPLTHMGNCEELEKIALEHAQRKLK